jgi:hypothetical protein
VSSVMTKKRREQRHQEAEPTGEVRRHKSGHSDHALAPPGLLLNH